MGDEAEKAAEKAEDAAEKAEEAAERVEEAAEAVEVAAVVAAAVEADSGDRGEVYRDHDQLAAQVASLNAANSQLEGRVAFLEGIMRRQGFIK